MKSIIALSFSLLLLRCGAEENLESTLTDGTSLATTLSYSYMGCYSSDRLSLPYRPRSSDSGTIEGCQAACLADGHKFAGLQAGSSSQCMCGDDVSASAWTYVESNCNAACSGSRTEVCGGANYKSIYRTSVPSNFLGCHYDNSWRDFPDPAYQPESGMNVDVCQSYCGYRHFKYSAVQYGTQCRCSNIPPRFGVAPGQFCDTNCSLVVPNQPAQICGGYYINDIYSTPSHNYGYKGCYVDAPNRVLEYIGSYDSTTCVAQCKARGAAYAGTENGNECRCGDGSLLGVPQDESQCATPCATDATQTCGGPWRLSVFATSY